MSHWEGRRRAQTADMGRRSPSLSLLSTGTLREEAPLHWQTNRWPFGRQSRSLMGSDLLGELPEFGKETKAVRLSRFGGRRAGEGVFVSRQHALRERQGRQGPGPIYPRPSDFPSPPPLPDDHFLMRTSPLRRLGLGVEKKEKRGVGWERRKSPMELSSRERLLQMPLRRLSPDLERSAVEVDPTLRFGVEAGMDVRSRRWPKREVTRKGVQDPQLPPWVEDSGDWRVQSALQQARKSGILPPGPPLGKGADGPDEEPLENEEDDIVTVAQTPRLRALSTPPSQSPLSSPFSTLPTLTVSQPFLFPSQDGREEEGEQDGEVGSGVEKPVAKKSLFRGTTSSSISFRTPPTPSSPLLTTSSSLPRLSRPSSMKKKSKPMSRSKQRKKPISSKPSPLTPSPSPAPSPIVSHARRLFPFSNAPPDPVALGAKRKLPTDRPRKRKPLPS